MTGDQIKAYLYLLCESWLESPRATLPNDLKQLARMANMDNEEFGLNWNGIMQNFQLGKDNRYFNSKLKRISDNQNTWYQNGLKGGNPNFKKGKNNPYLNQKDNQINNQI